MKPIALNQRVKIVKLIGKWAKLNGQIGRVTSLPPKNKPRFSAMVMLDGANPLEGIGVCVPLGNLRDATGAPLQPYKPVVPLDVTPATKTSPSPLVVAPVKPQRPAPTPTKPKRKKKPVRRPLSKTKSHPVGKWANLKPDNLRDVLEDRLTSTQLPLFGVGYQCDTTYSKGQLLDMLQETV